MKPDRYEVAVYTDESSDLATEMIELITRRTMNINDSRIRRSIIASALGTTAAMLDGIKEVNRLNQGGVTGRLKAVVDCWKP